MNIHQRTMAFNEVFGGTWPHNIEAEQSLLGAIIINNNALVAVDALVAAEDFFEPIHQNIFQICADLIRARKLANPVTLKTFLPNDLLIGGLPIAQYLARLAAEAATVFNAPDYARTIRDLANRRLILEAAEELAFAAKTADVAVPAEQIAADAIERFAGIISDRSSGQTSNIRPLNIAEFLKLELRPRQTILAPWLPEKGLAMIYSPRGIGKTLFGLTSAYAIASGVDFLGFRVERPRKVVYLDGEMPAQVMQERLAAIVSGFTQQPPTNDNFRVLLSDLVEGGLPDLATPDGQACIDARVGDAEVVFIDNISTLIRSGKENEAEGWLPVQNWILGHRRAGRALVAIHHAGKAGAQRGTSRREDVLDTVISLRRPSDYSPEQGARFELHYEKCRGFYGEEAQPFEAKYEVCNRVAVWTRTEIVDAELARVVAAFQDGMSIREAADALGMHRSKVDRLRKKAVEAGKLAPVSEAAE